MDFINQICLSKKGRRSTSRNLQHKKQTKPDLTYLLEILRNIDSPYALTATTAATIYLGYPILRNDNTVWAYVKEPHDWLRKLSSHGFAKGSCGDALIFGWVLFQEPELESKINPIKKDGFYLAPIPVVVSDLKTLASNPPLSRYEEVVLKLEEYPA